MGLVGLALLVVLVLPLVRPAASSNQVTVFVGDSYTHGTGASAPDRRWTTLLSAREGWTEINLGQGGTGYVATAGAAGCGRPFCGDYRSQVDAAAAARPGRVVIAGGQNDLGAFARNPTEVGAAVLTTVRLYHERLPGVEIVVVGPSVPGAVTPAATAFDHAVRVAAQDNGADYVSLLDPPVITPDMVVADRAHVNDAGHQAIASRVADGL